MKHLRSVHDGVRVDARELVVVSTDEWEKAPVSTSDGFPRMSEKLTWIIQTIPSVDGRKLTPERLARQIFEQTNGEFEVTASHLQNLKSGFRDNPSARLLLEISRAAGLPPAFFWSDAAESLLREVVERAIRDHDTSTSSYDALLLEALPNLNDEQVSTLRSVLLAVMGDPSPKDEPAP